MGSLQKTSTKSFLSALVLILVMVFSAVVFADPPQWRQGDNRRVARWEQRERKEWRKGDKQERKQLKKRSKFINGHDARDGRWDGRGPRILRIYPPRRWR